MYVNYMMFFHRFSVWLFSSWINYMLIWVLFSTILIDNKKWSFECTWRLYLISFSGACFEVKVIFLWFWFQKKIKNLVFMMRELLDKQKFNRPRVLNLLCNEVKWMFTVMILNPFDFCSMIFSSHLSQVTELLLWVGAPHLLWVNTCLN